MEYHSTNRPRSSEHPAKSLMSLPFRDFHLVQFFKGLEQDTKPLDFALATYFRSHKALGSKDRLEIVTQIYTYVRWKGLIDYLLKEADILEKFKFCKTFIPGNYAADETIPLHLRYSFPEELFQRLVNSYGIEETKKICLHSNQEAPVTIRVNALKTTRDALYDRWKERFPVVKTSQAPQGLKFDKKMPFFDWPEFKEGLFEMQDEGSQLVAELVETAPQQRVLDFCAGSGGKTLAYAPKLQGTGQIYLYDIRRKALLEAKKRLKRAGIQNAQWILPEETHKLEKLKKKMDWVLVDAPCTGTGTFRRNPDMKWKYNDELLFRLAGQQKTIFERALSAVKPGGHIVYATCSLLREENKAQVEHFLKTYDLTLEKTFESRPMPGEMDGLYGAVFKR